MHIFSQKMAMVLNEDDVRAMDVVQPSQHLAVMWALSMCYRTYHDFMVSIWYSEAVQLLP